jgi:Flp pilus assembly protein TadG
MKMFTKNRYRAGRESGSQLFEFAMAVPILFFLLVGVWDLGAGFALKQKLTNSAREGARIVSSTPSNSVDSSGNSCSPAPCNIQTAVAAVVQYMDKDGLDASCINSATPKAATSGNGWVYSCSKITLEIDRGSTDLQPYITVTLPGGSVTAVPVTIVKLTYPVSWTGGQLLPAPVPSSVSTQVEMQNLAP